MIALRKQYAAIFIQLATEATISGMPINRPIWWIDPLDEEAMKIDSGNNKFDAIDVHSFYIFDQKIPGDSLLSI